MTPMQYDPRDPAPRFLHGGGEMGRFIRQHDWSSTPLGPPAGWPQSLRTAVRLMLNTRHPMYMFWGPERLCFYNDDYRPSLGDEKHPSSLGRPAREVWAEIWQTVGGEIDQVMRGDGATWHENLLIPMTRNGVLGDVYWTYGFSPIDDDSAEHGVGGVLVVCTETTQAVLAARLAESQERLHLALSGGRGIGTWDWDVQADRVVADERFARLYNVDPQKARAGAPIAEFFASMHPDDVGRVRERVAEALRFGDMFSEEYRLVSPTGRICWVLAEGRCEMSADGRPLRFPGVSFDISDRKSIEQQLRVLNAELESKVVERALARGRTWKVSPELMGVIDAEGRFEASNPAWRAVLGWSETEVASRSFLDVIHPDDRERTRSAWADAVEHGTPALHFENRYAHKDGGYRWLSWVGVPEGGKVYCSARDVTGDKERDAALRLAEVALLQSQKREAAGPLAEAVAHDVDRLLAAIGSGLAVAEQSLADGQKDKAARFLSMAGEAVRRAASRLHRSSGFPRPPVPGAAPAGERTVVGGKVDAAVPRGQGQVVLVVDGEPLVRALVADSLQASGYRTLEAAEGPAVLRLLEATGRVDLLVTDSGPAGTLAGRELADAACAARPGLKVLVLGGPVEGAAAGPGPAVALSFDRDALARTVHGLLSG